MKPPQKPQPSYNNISKFFSNITISIPKLIVFVLLFGYCLSFLIYINLSTPPQTKTTVSKALNTFKETMNDMADEELLVRATKVLKSDSFEGVKKVAFLFLTRGELPFAPLWEMFFEGHEELYSIYVHTDPLYNNSWPAGSVFSGRRISSKAVTWGDVNMMEAERRLLANALLNPSNERFILLSESCVPLFNFPTVYSYLINSTTSFVESYYNGRVRYSARMLPLIPARRWRKGSQWFELARNLAARVVADDAFFPVFRRFCRHSCYVDEHYLPTMLSMRFGWLTANRTVTRVDWSRRSAHPARFIRPAVTPDLLRGMRGNTSCDYNGRNTTVCFMFARKFHPNSLTRFLRFAPEIMEFGKS